MSMTNEERKLFDTYIQKVEKLQQEKNQIRNRLDDAEGIIDTWKRRVKQLKFIFNIFAWLSFLLALLMTLHDYISRLLVSTKYFSFAQDYSIGTKQITAIVIFLVIGLICLRLGKR